MIILELYDWNVCEESSVKHYNDVIIGTMASQITNLTIIFSTVYSGADHRKYQSSASLAFVRGIHRWSVNSPHKWSVTRKMFAFDDVIMCGQRFHVMTSCCLPNIQNRMCCLVRYHVLHCQNSVVRRNTWTSLVITEANKQTTKT